MVEGSLRAPEIIANEVIQILAHPERFCFHAAADMDRSAAAASIARARRKAIANASRALACFLGQDVTVCAIVAKEGDAGALDSVLASHTRIHTAEGCFYRDVLREACKVPARIVPPSTLDISRIGKLAGPPWGRDQKLAALAAWLVLGDGRGPRST
jgi:hypothetical protein